VKGRPNKKLILVLKNEDGVVVTQKEYLPLMFVESLTSIG
jgi:hypothetical protein